MIGEIFHEDSDKHPMYAIYHQDNSNVFYALIECWKKHDLDRWIGMGQVFGYSFADICRFVSRIITEEEFEVWQFNKILQGDLCLAN